MSRVKLAKEPLFQSEEEVVNLSAFQLMSLPLELRLKIYSYLLPPRRHIIVTQTPYTGYFYNTLSLPTGNGYPFGRSAPSVPTGYKILSQNHHCGFPSAEIFPAILRTCKQVREEAEPVLYGGKHVEWDFGTHLAAAKTFWSGRSQLARESVRTLTIANEVSCLRNSDTEVATVDAKWVEFCSFMSKSLPNIWRLCLTLWSCSGSAATVMALEGSSCETDEKRWMESLVYEWIGLSLGRKLLSMDNLRELKLRTWDFKSICESGKNSLDSWLVQRMINDRTAQEKMIMEGVITERRIVVPYLMT